MNGYDIGQEYERQEVKDWASVSKAQVYYALKKLSAAGVLESVDITDANDPRGKTTYSVTQAGKHLLAEALEGQLDNGTQAPAFSDMARSFDACHP